MTRLSACAAQAGRLPHPSRMTSRRFPFMTITSTGILNTPGTITSKHDASKNSGAPERSVRREPQIAFQTDKSSRIGTDGSRRTPVCPNFLSDSITVPDFSTEIPLDLRILYSYTPNRQKQVLINPYLTFYILLFT